MNKAMNQNMGSSPSLCVIFFAHPFTLFFIVFIVCTQTNDLFHVLIDVLRKSNLGLIYAPKCVLVYIRIMDNVFIATSYLNHISLALGFVSKPLCAQTIQK